VSQQIVSSVFKQTERLLATGLIALLDDIAAIAKVAASSLDDIGAQTMKAGAKATGIVIDDTAVTPGYVVGFAADRELPIIWRIALGSLKNKLLILLPGALLLSLVAPWAITPLLMAGGAYLCFEGYEKVHAMLVPHEPHHEQPPGAAIATETAVDPRELEEEQVSGAIRTDFILSAEIMAITLATVAEASYLTQAVVLALVGIGITAMVYGAVALIVKADDVGVFLARTGRSAATRGFGRLLVSGMPWLLKALSLVGMLAMLWVGGGIVIHGLAQYGFAWPEHAIGNIGQAIGAAMPAGSAIVEWLVGATASGLVGLAIGALVVPLTTYVIAPLWRRRPRFRAAT
jgi:uncharacterized protein